MIFIQEGICRIISPSVLNYKRLAKKIDLN